ncbi:T9SS type A sorting domain-containing protein [Niastella populi]|uniref:Secretion system C-terminal sorting domain-containing protein n=1 Tax=Niastella populi TaxID=550983 RepID=A0A1V9FK82_9BACT|nr:T9SS type A sorting domain-containing protein [Niastella populi]OQP58793.1 hypothetical protein A4R26_22790 [Niastella populi]
MKKFYKIISAFIPVLLLTAAGARAQNNLSAGDIAFVSYQSKLDLTNIAFGGTTNFEDRFSIVVLKSGGLAAGTVIYFTDRGWSTNANDFIASTEGTIKWMAPAGGVAFGTEIYFISSYVDPVVSWNAYTTEAGTTTIGVVTTESGVNYMEVATAGDQVLAYQTGPAPGPAGTFDNTTRRFIAAIHANVESGVTTYANWDGASAIGPNQSSVPPGLSNGVTAMLLSQATLPATTGPAIEPDNGKLTTNVSACNTTALSTAVNTSSSWTLNNNAFPIGSTSGHSTFTLTDPVTVLSHPGNSTTCSGSQVVFNVTASGAGTLTYQWQESANAGFTSPVTLTNTGVYSGVNTASLTISNNTGLGGRYYRAVITNTCGAVNSNGALLTANASTLPTTGVSATQAITAGNNVFFSGCAIIAKILPSGASAVSGNVTSRVWIETSVPSYGGQPFAARHYEITPATNASAATGTVTLYFTQAEFDAFNAAPGSTLNLPTGPADNLGITNVRIGKYTGSSNDGTGLPGSYTSGAMLIDPADANVVWNATDSRWEITFDVTGFSGFILQTATSVLPVNLISFSARLANSDALVQWKTEGEMHNDYFEVERSPDGQTFTAFGKVAGNNGHGVQHYSFTDNDAALLHSSQVYYRLKIVSTTGETEYSTIVTLPLHTSGSPIVNVSPNPFTSQLKVRIQMPEAARVAIRLTDITGQLLTTQYMNVPKGQSVIPVTGVNNLVQGIYVLTVQFNAQVYTYKIVK